VYWLADRKAGKAMIVTIWDSEDAMNASEAARLKRQTGMAAATGAKVTTDRYEVVDSVLV
jgi:heme-degrading monooxygenase HmoA